MTSRRVLKVASAIREVVSMAILTDLKDPRIDHVTVTYVEVTGDLREAKVHVSIMGDEKKQQLCMHGLRSSAGYLQQKVSNRVDLRYTPRLKFVLDAGIKNAVEVSRILGEVLPESDEDSSIASEETAASPDPTDAPPQDSNETDS
jgi:ribosome-binding factor A